MRTHLVRATLAAIAVSSLVLAGLTLAGTTAVAETVNVFTDDDGNIHEGNIQAIAVAGITKGCNPPTNDRYCPSETVTRGQIAAFLVRALDLPTTGTDYFSDDDGTLFEADINRLAEAGITRGCNPPTNTLYCPDSSVTRGQMAALLVRAFGYSDDGGGNLFTDDDGSVFAGDIDKLATAGVTTGCNPPDNTRYCPNATVKRDQMASFLARALNLAPILPPTTTTSTSSTTTATAPPGSGFVAYIGCSQTKLAVLGYENLGGTRFEVYETGGGQINLWSRDDGEYWAAFDAAVAGKTLTAGWMEICITASNETTTTYQDVEDALAVFRSKLPEGASIYASGLEIYQPVDSCGIAGPTVPALTRQYADQLAADGLAARGPDLGPLTPGSTTDGCHPNAAGMELVGGQLLTFFGS